MKKIMLTIALAGFFTTGVVDDANAWIFTRNDKVTVAELQEAFGTGFVSGTKNYDGSSSYRLYQDFKNLETTYKTVKKAKDLSKINKNGEKIFAKFLEYMEKALIDIYQSEKPATLQKKTNEVVNYYASNRSSIDVFLKEQLANTAFESQIRNMVVPQLVSTVDESKINANKTYQVLDILNHLKGIVTPEISSITLATNYTPRTATQVIAEQKAAEEAERARKAADEAAQKAAAEAAAQKAAAEAAAQKAAQRRRLLFM